MSNRNFRRIILFAVACALALAMGAQALADQVYIRSSASVYANAGDSKPAGTLKAGTEVELVEERNGWAMIKKDGKTGYVQSSALLKVESVDNVTAYTASDTPMYKRFDGTGKLGTIPAGSAVVVSARAEGVSYVSYGGAKGFVKTSSLTSDAPAQAEPTPAPAEQEQSVSATAYVNRDGAKVYDSKGKVIGTLALNTQVTVTAVKDDLCRVESEGKTGYMYKSDLSSEKVAVEPTPSPEATPAPDDEVKSVNAYVNKDGAFVYNKKGEVIDTLPLDTEVTLIAVKGDLCQISVKGQTAYMKLEDLSKTASSSKIINIRDTTGYVAAEGAKVYDAEGNVIATLAINTTVKVVAYNDKLVKIALGNGYGYMDRSDVSSKKLDASSYKLKIGDSGEAVKKVQERLKELGYYNGTCDGEFGSSTKEAVAEFQCVMKMDGDGIVNSATLEALFADDAPKNPKTDNTDIGTESDGTSSVIPAKGIAVEMDWWESDIQNIFARGVTAKITDVETGLAWREQRRGGWNHADIQPVSAADTATFKKAAGGSWSWKRRAVFVTIDGKNYAASINCMPHGSGAIKNNNFDGHHCCHFTNSRTHSSDKLDEQHQAMVKKAASTRLE